MPEIEFIDAVPPVTDDGGWTPRRRPGRLPALVLGAVPALLCLIAAAVAVLAPFHRTVILSFPGDETGNASSLARQVEVLDGWGRVRIAGMAQPAAEHQIRYGILLCCCAGLLALAALGFALAAVRSATRSQPDGSSQPDGRSRPDGGAQPDASRRLRALARGLALLGGGGIATVSGIGYLDFLALDDSIHAQAAGAGAGPNGFAIEFGSFVWFCVAAAVVGLVAVVTSIAGTAVAARFRAEPQPEPGLEFYAAGSPDGGDSA